jgi:hypothetical protein
MTLDESLNHMLTAKTKGLQLLASQFAEAVAGIKEITEAGDLAALKTRVADARQVVGKLDQLLVNVEARAAQLTTDQDGGILDLSVPADRRK